MTARWYVLHVYSGFEQKISDSIMEQAAKKGIEDQIEEILVPTEEVVEMKRGQRVNTERRVFPWIYSNLRWNYQISPGIW